MTDTRVPEDAVKIVADVLALNAASVYEMDQEIVAALTRAYEFCPPETLAEIERLRAVAEVVQRFVVAADTRSTEKTVSVYVEEFRAALAAAPAGQTRAEGRCTGTTCRDTGWHETGAKS